MNTKFIRYIIPLFYLCLVSLFSNCAEFQQQPVKLRSQNGPACYSPDRKEIAFIRQFQYYRVKPFAGGGMRVTVNQLKFLYKIELKSRKLSKIAEMESDVHTWLPSGHISWTDNLIAFRGIEKAIYGINPDGTGRRILANRKDLADSNSVLGPFELSQDASKLAFLTYNLSKTREKTFPGLQIISTKDKKSIFERRMEGYNFEIQAVRWDKKEDNTLLFLVSYFKAPGETGILTVWSLKIKGRDLEPTSYSALLFSSDPDASTLDRITGGFSYKDWGISPPEKSGS